VDLTAARWGRSAVEDLAFLGLELGVGQHTGGFEFAELLELGEFVIRARSSGRCRVLRGWRGRWGLLGVGGLLFFLFLAGPPSLLAVSDAPGDGTGGAGDHSGAGDSTKQTWHG